ncbi:hypothetical protein [Novosphingobium album (ex Liu et al. 2023)]|uniref:DUF4129 domain-containing protein n=1 Tax=Novosphingobium album (ex Liu et al. 2023) TaxID=3031130 RepID=A0ABT5WM14_9SPHN|nr:hypothetical protein [Novosphingobium album (ex Liu et al. 2023)]MDE8651084.1 hypothetical protein [Novosphingobium album (ex Liu et al. 2023)]
MKVDGAQIAGSTAARDAASDWEAVRGSADIQYAPLPPVQAPEPPGWLQELGRLLARLLRPLGEFLGVSAPVIEKILIALAALLVLFLLWRLLLAPWLERRRMPRDPAAADWAPGHAEALALLEDADRLAAEGRYGEATHLLLRRSVGHIAQARPDWLIPATTAREIAALPALPERARLAFTAIATRVERSLFALRALDAEDWRAARAAYADFALAGLGG